MSNFLIIDLEMCKVPKGIKRQMLNLSSEIIQIGAVLVNEKLEIEETFQSFVKPQEGISWGAREVGSPCEWRGGARHCSRAMVGESGLETC